MKYDQPQNGYDRTPGKGVGHLFVFNKQGKLWNEKGQQLRVKENSSHFIDYQDCEGVGEGKMVCSGISELPNPASGNSKPYELGGLALLDMEMLIIKNRV